MVLSLVLSLGLDSVFVFGLGFELGDFFGFGWGFGLVMVFFVNTNPDKTPYD